MDAISGDRTINGNWASDCSSSHPERDGHYARFYSFSLDAPAEITITLESPTDPYLYLRLGEGRDGTVLCENDDYTLQVTGTQCARITSSLEADTDSGIVANLSAGAYTLEATTYSAGATGNYTLTFKTEPSTTVPLPTPSPTPTPLPLPTDYSIEDHACNEEDLTHLEGFVLTESVGPDSNESPGYSGITAQYSTRWRNADNSELISCTAVQFNSINNARWAGLDYSKQLQSVGVAVDIRSHEQAFIPWIGDDLLAYRVQYHADNDTHSSATVAFLQASTHTISRVIYFALRTDEYMDIAKPEGIARKIADRIFEASERVPESDSRANFHSLLESYGWLDRILD